MPDFSTCLMLVALAMLVWDCIEVGKNDAANLINGVFGARLLSRRTAVWLAGAAVLIGSMVAGAVMETTRKGFFDPGQLSLTQAMVVYVSAYIVDTALLHAYSAYGMPVSTTASLVFELLGATFGVTFSVGLIHWGTVGNVMGAMVVSVVLAGVAGFLVQRVFRAAIRDERADQMQVFLHGPWVAGLMLTWMVWFMVFKGMRGVPGVTAFRDAAVSAFGLAGFLLMVWGAMTLCIHLLLAIFQEWLSRNLFRILAVFGMLCLAFAFGQNDLANGAAPGLSAFWLWKHADAGTASATGMPIPFWLLGGCGLLMALGMNTKGAQRVTRAAVNTGSQYDHIALYAPTWCRRLARLLLRFRSKGPELAPPPHVDEAGKRVHFDALRAAVIMSVSASVIAFASSSGLPVSTTYVTFAAIVATGMGDRTMARGDADLKIGRAIWVLFSWIFGGGLAFLGGAGVAFFLYRGGTAGLVGGLALNLLLRFVLQRQSDRHEKRYHPKVKHSGAAATAEKV